MKKFIHVLFIIFSILAIGGGGCMSKKLSLFKKDDSGDYKKFES
ncbi:hypothetical protein [Leuconostoc mesenteroides]|nr:hypothetical protein [Leuconostoc mesenteroides]